MHLLANSLRFLLFCFFLLFLLLFLLLTRFAFDSKIEHLNARKQSMFNERIAISASGISVKIVQRLKSLLLKIKTCMWNGLSIITEINCIRQSNWNNVMHVTVPNWSYYRTAVHSQNCIESSFSPGACNGNQRTKIFIGCFVLLLIWLVATFFFFTHQINMERKSFGINMEWKESMAIYCLHLFTQVNYDDVVGIWNYLIDEQFMYVTYKMEIWWDERKKKQQHTNARLKWANKTIIAMRFETSMW